MRYSTVRTTIATGTAAVLIGAFSLGAPTAQGRIKRGSSDSYLVALPLMPLSEIPQWQ